MKTFIQWLKTLNKPKWLCYEIHRANMPQYGCESQCQECNDKQHKKFVVLEHLLLPSTGKRFWSTNTDDNTHLYDGRLAYKEILFTDSETEAIEESRKYKTI